MTGRLPAVVFGVLVAATFAAFFVAQRLKHDPSPLQGYTQRGYFSPNRDGRLDEARINFKLVRTDELTLEVLNSRGDVVRKLEDDRLLQKYRPTRFTWDGRDDDKQRVPDGRYRMRITLRREGRSIVWPASFVLDTKPPQVQVLSIGPKPPPEPGEPPSKRPKLLPSTDGAVAHVRFAAPARQSTATVFRTGPGPITRAVAPVDIPNGVRTWDWDGKLDTGKTAPPGAYVVVIASRDAAGNVGSSVPVDPRTRVPVTTYGTPFPGRGGITVRKLGVLPPFVPTVAGERGDIAIDSRGAEYNWSLRRVGGPKKPAKRGVRQKPFLRLHAPRGSVSRLYLLSVRANGVQQRVPYPVQADESVAGEDAGSPDGVLVVLPTMTWQGRNPVDDDGDGLPNLLDRGLTVPLARVYSGDGLPAGFAKNEGPLLAYLDRRRHRYDLTTDVVLAGSKAPDLRRYQGVLLAGDTRWLTAGAERALRAFAKAGGTVVSLGTESLRRQVTVSKGGRLTNPTPPSPTDVFGTRIAPVIPSRDTGVENFLDTIDLFEGGTGSFTGYDAYERTGRLAAGSKIVARAVDGQGRSVIVASTFGKGLVIRTGLAGFASHLGPDDNAAALMEAMWLRLSR